MISRDGFDYYVPIVYELQVFSVQVVISTETEVVVSRVYGRHTG